MASCKDCIHFKACNHWLSKENQQLLSEEGHICEHFKDRNKFVELPCKVGDTVYFIKYAFNFLQTPKVEKIQKIEIYDIDVIFRTKSRAFNDKAINDMVFLSREEAEKALEERENNG